MCSQASSDSRLTMSPVAPTPASMAAEAATVGTNGPGATTRYMVKVRLDSKKVLSITRLRQQLDGLKVGSRVIVQGVYEREP